MEATPTPTPTMNLPTIKRAMLGATACRIAPNVKQTSAKMITFFLPILSDTMPENSAPIAAPISANETTKLIYTVLISGQVSLK